MQKFKNILDKISLRVFLVLLIFLYVCFLWYYLKVDKQIPYSDPANYFVYTFTFWDILTHFSFAKLQHLALIMKQPPLVCIVVRPFFFFLEKNLNSAVFAMNVIFLPVLVFSISGIIEQLTRKASLGILGSAIVLCYPGIIILSRNFFFDFPLVAMVYSSIYFLLRSDDFTNRKYAVLFGICAGLGILTKLLFAVFFAPLILYEVFRIRSKRQLVHFLIAVLIFLAVAALWYIPNFTGEIEIFRSLKQYTFGAFAAQYRAIGYDPNAQKFWPSYFLPLVRMNNDFIGIVNFILFILAVLLFCRGQQKNKGLLITWLIASYLFLNAKNTQRVDRYYASFFPMIAIITLAGFNTLKSRLKYVFYFSLALYGLFQFIICTWDIPFLPDSIALWNRPRIYLLNQQPQYMHQWYPRPVHKQQDWHINEFLETLRLNGAVPGELILILGYCRAYDPCSLSYHSMIRGLGYTFNWPMPYIHLNVVEEINRPFYKYIVDVKQVEPEERIRKKLMVVRQYIEDNPGKFKIIFEKELPYGKYLVVYKKTEEE